MTDARISHVAEFAGHHNIRERDAIPADMANERLKYGDLAR